MPDLPAAVKQISPQANDDLYCKRPMKKEAQPPWFETGRDCKEGKWLVQKWRKQPNITDKTVEDHMEKSPQAEDQCQKGESAAHPQGADNEIRGDEPKPENGPVSDVSVVMGLAMLDEVEIEHVEVGSNGTHNGRSNHRNGRRRDDVRPAQYQGRKNISGWAVGNEHDFAEGEGAPERQVQKEPANAACKSISRPAE